MTTNEPGPVNYRRRRFVPIVPERYHRQTLNKPEPEPLSGEFGRDIAVDSPSTVMPNKRGEPRRTVPDRIASETGKSVVFISSWQYDRRLYTKPEYSNVER
ncbi:hypothetical protein AArcCO_1340 [Halalkaliarchaeum sp. AArc-CO]|nr:hypothetical protein AArcCO_1340 [Halalkaliarchaeum sp. AArc-CO]